MNRDSGTYGQNLKHSLLEIDTEKISEEIRTEKYPNLVKEKDLKDLKISVK